MSGSSLPTVFTIKIGFDSSVKDLTKKNQKWIYSKIAAAIGMAHLLTRGSEKHGSKIDAVLNSRLQIIHHMRN
jgi:hypothetical protein